ncbi:hypothetical protein BDEG_26787 [Batrachochytrium dendrobatidis JEL423]|uniref:Uncharacterized protein n=2 Tax=Batrachochytrium dendrobatidis TaxID=109871 RepID=A0A177WUU1_BATDL|nr:hypothetical protein BDEG_26787 [Batrachochytrium dendrobatidis JEL423]
MNSQYQSSTYSPSSYKPLQPPHPMQYNGNSNSSYQHPSSTHGGSHPPNSTKVLVQKPSNLLMPSNGEFDFDDNYYSQQQLYCYPQPTQVMPAARRNRDSYNTPVAIPTVNSPPPTSFMPMLPIGRGSLDDIMNDRPARPKGPSDTQILADFLRNTGPPSPPSSSQANLRMDSSSTKKKAKRQTGAGSFFGWGRKKSMQQEADTDKSEKPPVVITRPQPQPPAPIQQVPYSSYPPVYQPRNNSSGGSAAALFIPQEARHETSSASDTAVPFSQDEYSYAGQQPPLNASYSSKNPLQGGMSNGTALQRQLSSTVAFPRMQSLPGQRVGQSRQSHVPPAASNVSHLPAGVGISGGNAARVGPAGDYSAYERAKMAAVGVPSLVPIHQLQGQDASTDSVSPLARSHSNASQDLLQSASVNPDSAAFHPSQFPLKDAAGNLLSNPNHADPYYQKDSSAIGPNTRSVVMPSPDSLQHQQYVQHQSLSSESLHAQSLQQKTSYTELHSNDHKLNQKHSQSDFRNGQLAPSTELSDAESKLQTLSLGPNSAQHYSVNNYVENNSKPSFEPMATHWEQPAGEMLGSDMYGPNSTNANRAVYDYEDAQPTINTSTIEASRDYNGSIDMEDEFDWMDQELMDNTEFNASSTFETLRIDLHAIVSKVPRRPNLVVSFDDVANEIQYDDAESDSSPEMDQTDTATTADETHPMLFILGGGDNSAKNNPLNPVYNTIPITLPAFSSSPLFSDYSPLPIDDAIPSPLQNSKASGTDHNSNSIKMHSAFVSSRTSPELHQPFSETASSSNNAEPPHLQSISTNTLNVQGNSMALHRSHSSEMISGLPQRTVSVKSPQRGASISEAGDVMISTTTADASIISPVPRTSSATDSKRKRRVRHVQIQTRSTQLREIQTQTDAEQTHSGLDAETAKRIEALETEVASMHDKNVSLTHKLGQTQQELSATLVSKDRIILAMDDNKKKFDGLSAQAYKKIKELLKDRQMLDIEVKVLKSQLEALDQQYQELNLIK